ncbi:MAG: NADH-quinone oxidoreductase subunit M [Chromatiales bacterium]|nr:NADH-quinone oxidoreductase subunit M [Chromatiales bacterium]
MDSLTLLLLSPFAGAILIALLPGDNRVLLRGVAIAASVIALLLSWMLLLSFDSGSAAIQLDVGVDWNRRLGTSFALGVDGISLPMVLLATLLSLIAVLASASITENAKGYYALLLTLESAMLGVFMAQDWVLFYVFWELTLIPLFFLINGWGGSGRQGAALNFVLYTMGGSVFMLLALLLVFDEVGSHSFAFADILAGAHGLPAETQLLIFLGFLIGFGVKMPLFPLHGWLPLAHVEAPSPVSILLSGVLLKMGSYGLLRATAMLPEAAMAMQGVLLALALIAIIYGGMLAWRQSDLKRMVAYSSVSHMGVVLLGIAALNVHGITGAVMQMVAHGLVAAALFLLIGLLYERTHTRDINDYSSLVRITPRFAFFTSLAFVAAIGMPGTAGFVAELHALIGGFERWGWLVIGVSLGVLISAAYAVRTLTRLFTGPVRQEMRGIRDLERGELMAASVLSLGILLLGFAPAPALQLMGASVAQLGHLFAGIGG